MIGRGMWGAAALVVGIGLAESRAETPVAPAPKDFVLAALQSDQYEILAASVATAQSKDERIRSFAAQMSRDHSRLSADLRQAATASDMAAPEPGLSGDEAMLLSGLQGVRGSSFDKTYAHQQVLAHAAALAVVESFAAAGTDPNLKKAAEAALPTIREHLKMARQLASDVGQP